MESPLAGDQTPSGAAIGGPNPATIWSSFVATKTKRLSSYKWIDRQQARWCACPSNARSKCWLTVASRSQKGR